jgi:hypothetical protein
MITVCPDCERGVVAGFDTERSVSPAALQTILCDAQVLVPGERNRSTVRPALRREVLRRDGHRCRVRGCGRRLFVNVHHVLPREAGGPNTPANLLTLCWGCHRAVHERGIHRLPIREVSPPTEPPLPGERRSPTYPSPRGDRMRG